MSEYIARPSLMAKLTSSETQHAMREMDGSQAYNLFLSLLNAETAADVAEVTRCKDCEHAGYINNTLYCYYWSRNADEDAYCSEGYCVSGGADNAKA